MSRLTTKLSHDNKDFLHLLTRLTSQIGKSFDFQPNGVEALVNIEGEEMSQKEIEETVNLFAPLKTPRYQHEIEEINNYMDRSQSIAELLLKVTPENGPEDTPYADPVIGLSSQMEEMTEVDIRMFDPKHIRLMMATTFQREVPKTINMLATSNPNMISHLYFAALQYFDGFAPHRNDRATENMMNIMYIEGLSPQELQAQTTLPRDASATLRKSMETVEQFKRSPEYQAMNFFEKEIVEMASEFFLDPETQADLREHYSEEGITDEDENKALEFMVRLHAEHIKPMLFHGNINPSGTSAVDFLEQLYNGHFKMKKEFADMLKDTISGDLYDGWHEDIASDPVEYFARMRPDNIDRLLYTSEVKNYEDILKIFLEDIPKYPAIFRMNQHFYATDEEYEKTARFVKGSTDQLKEEKNLDKQYSLQKVQHYIIDNQKTTIQNKSPKSAQILFQIAKHLPYEKLNDNIVYKTNGIKRYVELGLQMTELFEDDSIMPLWTLAHASEPRLYEFTENFSQTFGDLDFSKKLLAFDENPDHTIELMEFFANFAKERKLRDYIACDEITLEEISQGYTTLRGASITPTPHLIQELISSDDQNELIKTWEQEIANGFNNQFDKNNETHKNLAYTQFTTLLESSAFKERIPEDFEFKWDFESYKQLLNQTVEHSRLHEDIEQFEIECAAFEASQMMHYIQNVKENADRIGKEVLVIPNFSYGYIPSIPIYEDLLSQGIKVFMGAKIGSTESHSNPNVFNENLLSGIEEYVFDQKPVIVVMDGTTHIISRGKKNLNSRYPDSYQGFKNTVTAINEAQNPYTGHEAKEMPEKEEDNLRNTYGYKSFVERNAQRVTNIEYYDFKFWNTGEYGLISRELRKESTVPTLFDPEYLTGPALIFCNVGLLDEDIPESIKRDHDIGDYEHIPAYFDDTNHIINIQLKASSEGIVLGNDIEPLLKKAYSKYCNAKNNLCNTNLTGESHGHIKYVQPEACWN